MEDTQTYEMVEIYSPKSSYDGADDEAARPVLDIVIVGSMVDSLRQSPSLESQSDDECNWFQDLLPKHISSARVITFARQSTTKEDTTEDVTLLSATGLIQNARALLDCLAMYRTDGDVANIPITFAAYDLGGSIVKKALILASESQDEVHLAIFNNTRRLLFFGTPHRAHYIMSWVNLLFNILSTSRSPQSLKLDLHKRAVQTSKELETIDIAFGAIAPRYSLINVHQGNTDQRGQTIVDRYSSTTGFSHEINISRETGYLDLGDFSQDIETFSVLAKLLSIDTDSDRAECLSTLLSLSLPSIVPMEEEFDILDMGPDLDAWIQSPSPAAVYVQGLRGTADGPISNTLFRKLRERSLAALYYKFRPQDRRRASAIPLFSSFIYQVLAHDPGKFDRIRELYRTLKSRSIYTPAAVQTMFQALLSTDDLDTVILVIDGIHAPDDCRKSLLDDLTRLIEDKRLPTKLKIAVFDQDSQIIKELPKSFISIVLPLDSLEWPRQQVSSLSSQAVAKVIEERPYLKPFESDLKVYLEKSEDSSQLALSLHSLLDRTNDSPSSQASFRLKIQALPPTVNDMVCSIYKTLPEWAKRALGWVLHAQRPLRLNELSAAIALFPSDGSEFTVLDESSLFLDISTELEMAFGPLIMVNSGEVLLSDAQFGPCFTTAMEQERHQKSQAPSAEIGIEQIMQGEVLDDSQITLLLLKYLSSETFGAEVRKTLRQDPPGELTGALFAMAEYAVQFWPAHYREAEKQGLQHQEILPFLNKKEFVKTWYELNSSFESTTSQPDYCVSNGLGLAAQLGLDGLVGELQKGIKGDFRDLTLTLASWGGHLNIVKILLNDQFDQSPCDMTPALRNASIGGYEEIVRLILDHRVDSQRAFTWDSEILCRAAELGYETEVILFLENGAPVDAAFGGTTPLQLAVRNGHAAIVQRLLSTGADPNSDKAQEFLKPVLEAVKSGQTSILQHLLTSNAIITVSDHEERTPLHLAARNGQNEMVKLLLERFKSLSQEEATGTSAAPDASIGQSEADIQTTQKPRDIDRRDEDGNSPLALACKSGHAEVVDLLLAAGAQVDLVDNDDHTAIYIATKRRHQSIAEALLRHRDGTTSFKDIDNVFLESSKAGFLGSLRLLLDSPVDHKTVWKNLKENETGMTALHYAAQHRHDDVVKFLVQELDVTVDLGDNYENTPLMLAAVASSQAIVRFLLDKNANPMHTNRDGQTVLHLVSAKDGTAFSANDQEVIETFLDFELNPNIKDNDMESALHLAANSGNFAVAETLLQGGADAMAKNRTFWTPLHKAACYGHEKFCQLLIDNGVDTLDTDDDGWTAMHIAARWGRVGVMKLLAKASPIAVSKRALDGRTALHFAYDEVEAIKWLLEQKIDKDAMNESKETALIIASRYGYDRVVDLLLTSGADPKLANDLMETALHIAAEQGYETILKLILSRLSADAVNAKDETSKKLILSVVNAKNEVGLAPLQLAIRANETGCAAMLLGHPHIDINVRDEEEMTPLLSAVDNSVDQSLVEILLKFDRESKDYKPDISYQVGIHARDRQGRTALHIAAARDSRDIFKLLVTSEAEKEAKDIQGRTVVHHTAMMNSVDILGMLLQDDTFKALNVKDNHGWSPLHWACRTDKSAPVVQLMLQGKDIVVERSEPSLDGWTPENIAIFHNASLIADILQNHTKDPVENAETQDLPIPQQEPGQKRWKVGRRQRCKCDGCELDPVYGVRWKCEDCRDFDFCFKCYWTVKETHPDHNFTKHGMDSEKSPESDEDDDTASDTDDQDNQEDE